MHYGSYKGTHMKLKDNNFCPYNVTLSEMSENSSVTKKQKQKQKKIKNKKPQTKKTQKG